MSLHSLKPALHGPTIGAGGAAAYGVGGRLGVADLIAWRLSEGLSQAEAGRWLRIRQQRVSDLESGVWRPWNLHERLLWALWRYYGLVEEGWTPPKPPGPRRRAPRRKRPDPFEKYEQLARESQLTTPFKR